jgi:hypothetical protein
LLNLIKNTVQKNDAVISDETLAHKIYEIHGEKVMLDRDLAALYGVETKYLKRQSQTEPGKISGRFYV